MFDRMTLVKLIDQRETARSVRLISKLSPNERANLCIWIISIGDRTGFTVLTLAIYRKDEITAAALIKDLTADQRAAICNTFNTTGLARDFNALTHALYNKLNTIAVALVNELTADQKMKICTSKTFDQFERYPNTLILAIYCNIDVALILIHGLSVEQRYHLCNISTGVINNYDRKLIEDVILDGRQLKLADALIQDFSPDQKRDVLTPYRDRITRENSLIIWATEPNRSETLAWLLKQGITLPPRLRQNAKNRGINSCSISAAVSKTVRDSLSAVKKAQSLSQVDVENTIKVLIEHANKLPDSHGLTTIKSGAKDALKKMTTQIFLNYRDKNSQLSLAEILAYIFINLQMINDPVQKMNALSVFYIQLCTIQVLYAPRDRDINDLHIMTGVISYLTIALQAVCPDLAWVVFANMQTVAINGLNILPEILCEIYKNSDNRVNFAKLCATKPEGLIIPYELWPQVETELKQKMKKGFYNNKFDPPRCALEDDDSVEDMIESAVQILKSGICGKYFTKEMLTPADKINELIADIVLSAGNFADFRMRRPISNDTKKNLNSNLNLDKSILMLEEESKIVPPKTNRRSLQEFYLYSFTSTSEPFSFSKDKDLIERCKIHACKKLPDEQLPDTFKMIAGDRNLLEILLNEIEKAKVASKSQIYLFSPFTESLTARMWVKSNVDIEKTMRILGISERKKDQEVNNYLYENSARICEVLMYFVPEMITNSIKSETQKEYDNAFGFKKVKK